MRLVECHIENFGKLRNMDVRFSEGLHVICENNGWGKSTLASFLKVMFYGFENERVRDEYSNERKRFRPWQGGIYGGQVTFSVGTNTYILSRIFGMKEKEDVFSLKDAKTNLDSEDYSVNIGEEIFGIDRASFEKTIFLSQNDCETKVTGNIHAKLGNLTESMDDISQYEKASGRLNDLLNAYSPTRKTGLLYKKRDEITKLEMEIKTGAFQDENLNRLSDAYYRQFLERKEAKEQKRNFFGPEIPSEEDLLAYLDLSSKLKAMEQMAFLKEEKEKDIRNTRKKETMKNLGFLSFGILLVGAGILLNLKSVAGMMTMLVGMAITGISMIFYLRSGKNQQDSIDINIEEIDHLRNKMNAFLENYGFTPNNDYHDQFLNLLEKLREYKIAYNECEKARSRMDQFELEYENAKKESREDLLSSLNDLKEEYQQLSEKYKRLKKTREYLAKAKESFTAKYKNPLMEGFLKYYYLLTGENGDPYVIDANIDLSVKEQGLLREARYLSRGNRDLTGICMRMALVDAMYEKEKPFLIFDDPFVNLDVEKTKKGRSFLNAVGKEYQILYFTCHESRK